MRRSVNRSAFTLIEVLMVVAILVMLAAGAVVTYNTLFKGAQKDTTTTEVNKVKNLVETFNVKMKRYPSADKGLQELITAPEDEKEAAIWKNFGPLLQEMPKDAWGHELKYELTDKEGSPTFRVYSCGPNGIEGDDDDLPAKAEAK